LRARIESAEDAAKPHRKRSVEKYMETASAVSMVRG
jgi:hypothetical protein